MVNLVDYSKGISSVFEKRSICNKNLLVKGKPNTPIISSNSLSYIFIAIMIGFSIIIGYLGVSYKNLQDNIDDYVKNWDEIRCKPNVIPFASIISKRMGNSISITDNITYCTDSYAQSKFQYFISPFTKIITNIVSVIQQLFEKQNVFENIANGLKDSLDYAIEESKNTFDRFTKKLYELVNESTAIFLNIGRVFQDIITAMLYLKAIIYDMFNSLSPMILPLRLIMDFFCFSPYTNITMSDYTTKPISNLCVGDTIYKGGKVLAIHVFNGKNTPMYSYNNVVVSGYHIVFEKTPIRIGLSKKAIPISIREDTIYCLTTENGFIVSNNTIFSDFIEAQNQEQMNYISNTIIQSLSPNTIWTKSDRVWGFHPNTYINTINGTKQLQDIQIGDFLEKNNKVEGISIIQSSDIDIYEYNSIIVSGNVIVYDNQSWKYISNCSKKIDNYPYLYHIYTTKGTLQIQNILFRDSYQTYNRKTHSIIDNTIESVIRI